MQNMRLCCFSLFDLQDPLDVVDHDVDHQRHQKHQAREVNHTLQVSPDWFSADGFYDQKDKPPSSAGSGSRFMTPRFDDSRITMFSIVITVTRTPCDFTSS